MIAKGCHFVKSTINYVKIYDKEVRFIDCFFGVEVLKRTTNTTDVKVKKKAPAVFNL